jgi:single-strand DNA-binding protein
MQKLRNNVRLIGRLGRDPQIRNLPGGKRVANFSLATSDNYKNGQGERIEETQWHNLVVWGKLVDLVADYLHKGKEVAVEGKLVHRKYETSAGEMRYITEVNVDEILLLGTKPREEAVTE